MILAKIGIISDSHDNIEAIPEAVALLNKAQVDLVIHGGDIIAPFSLRLFEDLDCPAKFVFGNNDGERDILKMLGEKMGTTISDLLDMEFEGIRIVAYHGTDPRITSALIKSRTYDLVIFGHTHLPEVENINGTMVINPGELCGYSHRRRTLAIFDTDTRKGEIVEF